ncbi:MAG: nucleotide exchange factor GrpE [Longimicrobiales bacterium]
MKKPEDRRQRDRRPNGESGSDTDPAEAGPDRNPEAASGPTLEDLIDDSGPTVDELEAELGSARGELDRAMDQFRRLAADFDNYKKRVERERVETTSRAQAEFARRLLEIVDDLERVTAHAENTPTPLLEGVQLVERKLHRVLGSLGLERIAAEGETFDPKRMEGIATMPAKTPEEDDTVADVFQQGYLFRGQVLRPARVRVKQFEVPR